MLAERPLDGLGARPGQEDVALLVVDLVVQVLPQPRTRSAMTGSAASVAVDPASTSGTRASSTSTESASSTSATSGSRHDPVSATS